MRYSKGWGAALIVMLLLILDQALKIWIKTHMQLHESIEITPWFYPETQPQRAGTRQG